MEYWGIDELFLEPCCQHRYNQKKELVYEEIRKEVEILKSNAPKDNFGEGKWARVKKVVWDLMENPQTSVWARVCNKIFISY